ncbi:uncharacterized protein LOC122243105 [Penaeus japonicus]|uniref:uncharacterized protein LOC122243105 n=1 Tax=Penaeus japonicus TaxID=27405 RepID=UPI001C70CBFF|nr:uncharacterized protein LOC122243105 [Penaeus japonicus]
MNLAHIVAVCVLCGVVVSGGESPVCPLPTPGQCATNANSTEKVWRVFSLQPTLKKLVSHYSPFKVWQTKTQHKQQLGYQAVQYTEPKSTQAKYYKPKEYGPLFFQPQYQPVSYADDSV